MRMIFAAIVAAMLAAPMPLLAQQSGNANSSEGGNQSEEPKVDITRNGDWEVACQEAEGNNASGKVCEMRQVLVRQETDEEWLRIAVSYTSESDKPVLRIFSPLGVLLQPGMELKIDDGEAMRMQYAICLSRPPRCLVAGPMEEQLVNLMKRGIKGSITFVLPNNRKVTAPFSLDGFTKSLNSLPR